MPGGLDSKYGHHPFVGKPGEPLFIIRGQDAAAVPVLREYERAVREVGASEEFLTEVKKSRMKFEDWQKANQDKVKVPD